MIAGFPQKTVAAGFRLPLRWENTPPNLYMMGMEQPQEELTTKVNNISMVPCGFSLDGGDTPLLLYWTLIVCRVHTVPRLRRKPRQNQLFWSPETHRQSAESTVIGNLALLNLTWRRIPFTFTVLDATCRSEDCEEEPVRKSQQLATRVCLSWGLLPETWYFQPLSKDVIGFYCLMPKGLLFFLKFS